MKRMTLHTWSHSPTDQPLNTIFRFEQLRNLLSRGAIDVDYLVDGMLVRGTVSCLVARPKVGKSTFARALCLAVAKGGPFLGRKTEQGVCIYLALEERREEVTSDFRAMGADGTELITVHADAAPETAIRALVQVVQEKRPALVVVDPLIRMLSGGSEKGYAEVYQAFGHLIDCARATGTHILLVHHAGKARHANAIDSPLGSTAIAGGASTLIELRLAGSLRTIQTVQRVGLDIQETVLAFDQATRRLSVGGTRAEADREEVEREMVEYLKAVGEKIEEEINQHVEGMNAVKRRALRSLVEKGILKRDGRGARGDPFRYSYACTEPTRRTSVQESGNASQLELDLDQTPGAGPRQGVGRTPSAFVYTRRHYDHRRADQTEE